MRYSASRARREFDTWLKDASSLIQAARKQPPEDRNVRDGILCASLFLTHARFENFFKDIVSLVIIRLNRLNIPSKLLPGRLRAAHLIASIPHPHLKHYYVYKNERLLLDNFHESIETINLAWASASYKGILDASVIVESKGYPSSENLKSVFHKLGVSIFTECNRKMKTDVAALIDSIGDLRSEMAHLGVPSRITEDDVEKKIKDLRNIVATIDRIVHEQFLKPTKVR